VTTQNSSNPFYNYGKLEIAGFLQIDEAASIYFKKVCKKKDEEKS
jgi:hypothetical protein